MQGGHKRDRDSCVGRQMLSHCFCTVLLSTLAVFYTCSKTFHLNLFLVGKVTFNFCLPLTNSATIFFEWAIEMLLVIFYLALSYIVELAFRKSLLSNV